mmetsp:Transcript_2286/g.5299  ORF Transcript_2286/g.5299 Transcript_2286/m.5299 type:complete len:259 (-) Transcript_2286:797-1573(-)
MVIRRGRRMHPLIPTARDEYQELPIHQGVPRDLVERREDEAREPPIAALALRVRHPVQDDQSGGEVLEGVAQVRPSLVRVVRLSQRLEEFYEQREDAQRRHDEAVPHHGLGHDVPRPVQIVLAREESEERREVVRQRVRQIVDRANQRRGAIGHERVSKSHALEGREHRPLQYGAEESPSLSRRNHRSEYERSDEEKREDFGRDLRGFHPGIVSDVHLAIHGPAHVIYCYFFFDIDDIDYIDNVAVVAFDFLLVVILH